mmetsp:Transcript_8033/g.21281  ORF Transcript_8033/g.21281 Transcript_8033/m.21281 type:complete len:242 (+) Transcript_8033:1756-2481(+)
MEDAEWDAVHTVILWVAALLAVVCLVTTATLQYVRQSRRAQLLLYYVPQDPAVCVQRLPKRDSAALHDEHVFETEVIKKADALFAAARPVHYRSELVLESSSRLEAAAQQWFGSVNNRSKPREHTNWGSLRAGLTGSSSDFVLPSGLRFSSGDEDLRVGRMSVDKIVPSLQKRCSALRPLASECDFVRSTYLRARWFPSASSDSTDLSPHLLDISESEYLRYLTCVDAIVEALYKDMSAAS